MKKVNFLCLIVLGVFFSACHSDERTWGDWEKSDFYPGNERVLAVSFEYKGTVYVGMGFDGDVKPKDKYLRNFYKFDGTSWISVTESFPAKGRQGCVAFVIKNIAYVGAGYRAQGNGEEVNTYYSDFYQFNLDNDEWVKDINDATGYARTDIAESKENIVGDDSISSKFWGGIGFELNGKGYVGTGNVDGRISKSMFCYDPTTEEWSSKPMPGDPRAGGVVFKIGQTAVIALGTDGSKPNVDVVTFDGTTWVEKEPVVDKAGEWNDKYSGIARHYAVAFTSDLDYGLCGYIAGGSSNTVWRYKLEEDRWHEVEHFSNAMAPRLGAIGFSINEIGYITTGGSSLSRADNNTTWKFTPGVEEEDYNDF